MCTNRSSANTVSLLIAYVNQDNTHCTGNVEPSIFYPLIFFNLKVRYSKFNDNIFLNLKTTMQSSNYKLRDLQPNVWTKNMNKSPRR